MNSEISVITDCFTIGSKSHYMCEDYSLVYNNPYNRVHFAIICDGCSSGENTDVGARLLAHITKNYLIKQLEFGFFPTVEDTWKTIISNTKPVISALNLCDDNLRCLLSTVLILFKFNDMVHVYMYGDGSVVVNYNDGTYVIHTVTYPENAPDYIAYRLNPRIRSQYYTMVGRGGFNLQSSYVSENWCNNTTKEDTTSEYQSFYFPIEKVSNITIFSDGIDSFRKTGEEYQEKIVIDYVKNLHNFKSYAGEFIKKRCKGFLREVNGLGYTNMDDFSMATIHIFHEE